jgi:hypothetical protein
MKTDNSYFEEKILLRLETLKCLQSPVIILDCYSGKGKLWDEVKKRTKKELIILRIEKEIKKGNKIYLQGDNRKYLKSINLDQFNIIDLDAYGIPFDQLKIIIEQNYKGIIIVTAIQSMMGNLPLKLLYENGFTKKMINKIPTIFFRKGIDKLKNYLYLCGVKQVTGYFIERKSYFYFKLN